MTADKTERFLSALEIVAPSDSSGLRIFKERMVSVCAAKVTRSRRGVVFINSLVSIGNGNRDGRRVALAAINYLADVYDITLMAEDGVVLRDVGGSSDKPDWLERSGFVWPRGESCLFRLPQSLHRVAA
jgi:hypothetical protein